MTTDRSIEIAAKAKFDRQWLPIEASTPSIAKLLPEHMTPDRFMMQIKFALKKTPKLLECEPASLLESCLAAADLGLDPSGRLGSAWLIPFAGKVTLIPGYRGLIDLACRSGFVRSSGAWVVHEKDEWRERNGFTPLHIPYRPRKRTDVQSPGDWFAAWARFKLPGGATESVVMPWAEIMAIRDKSPAVRTDIKYKNKTSPWWEYEEEMAKKTVLRRGLKTQPLSAVVNTRALERLTRALELDDKNEDDALEALADSERLPSGDSTTETQRLAASLATPKEKVRKAVFRDEPPTPEEVKAAEAAQSGFGIP